MNINFFKAQFITSAAQPHQFPQDLAVEIAFIGRSNAGKSTALNALTGTKGLARTSKTPGRTQMINFFLATEPLRLVDLPGYGFAQISLDEKKRISQLLSHYFTQREMLAGVVLLMDVRHPLLANDLEVYELLQKRGVPVLILLTKADKLSKNQRTQSLQKVKQQLKTMPGQPTDVQLFSVPLKIGLSEAREWVIKKLV